MNGIEHPLREEHYSNSHKNCTMSKVGCTAPPATPKNTHTPRSILLWTPNDSISIPGLAAHLGTCALTEN